MRGDGVAWRLLPVLLPVPFSLPCTVRVPLACAGSPCSAIARCSSAVRGRLFGLLRDGLRGSIIRATLPMAPDGCETRVTDCCGLDAGQPSDQRTAGSSTVKVLPAPGWLITDISP